MRRKDDHPLSCLLAPAILSIICALGFGIAHASEPITGSGREPTVTREESELIASVSSRFDKNPEAAIAQLRARTGPEASAALDFALAAMLAQEKRFGEAVDTLEIALGKFPAFQRAWLLSGRVRILQGDTSSAIKPLRKALDLGADQAEVFKLLAYCHLADGHAVASESAYRQVMALAPEDKEALAGLARALLMQERCADAAPLLRSLCEHNPGKAEYWVLRANNEMVQGRNRRAIVLLECARRLSNVDRQSLLALGDLYFNEGLYMKATACYEEAAAGRMSAAMRVRYAEALLDAGQPLLAQKLLGEDIQQDGREPERLHLVRARVADAEDDFKQAMTHLDAALRANPMSGDALLMLARLQKEGGDPDRAVLTFERASRIESHQRRALFGLAQIYVDRSEYTKAADQLEEAQKIRFDPAVARYLEQVRRAMED